MTIETPCRVRDGEGFLEPLEEDRESLQLRGVHALSLSKGSLKRMRGPHLRGRFMRKHPHDTEVGGFCFSAFPPTVPL